MNCVGILSLFLFPRQRRFLITITKEFTELRWPVTVKYSCSKVCLHNTSSFLVRVPGERLKSRKSKKLFSSPRNQKTKLHRKAQKDYWKNKYLKDGMVTKKYVLFSQFGCHSQDNKNITLRVPAEYSRRSKQFPNKRIYTFAFWSLFGVIYLFIKFTTVSKLCSA